MQTKSWTFTAQCSVLFTDQYPVAISCVPFPAPMFDNQDGEEMTMKNPHPPSANPLILPYQKPVFDRLCAVARACLYVDRRQFSALKFRACFWLIGPTGSGKSFLAKALAQEMDVPFLSISVSDWMILGASNRGSTTTWPSILSFINKHKQKQGAIIFVDELDKCRDESNWNSFLRTEIFSLCDSRIPPGIKDLDSDIISEHSIQEAETFLRNKTMIIGGSAFQDIWEERSSTGIGFNQTPQTTSLPELPDLARILPREFVNRFCSEMFILPKIQEKDYLDMVETMAVHVPELWRNRFIDLGLSRIDQALRHQKGARYLEEILLSAVVEERAHLVNFKPEQQVGLDAENPEDLNMLGV